MVVTEGGNSVCSLRCGDNKNTGWQAEECGELSEMLKRVRWEPG